MAAGIMAGYPDGSFRPDQPLTRGRGPLTKMTRTSYSDVPATFWAWADTERASGSHRSVRNESGEEELVEYIDATAW